jgi:hypothetical protein
VSVLEGLDIAALAPRSGLPGTRTETTYLPPADLTFEEWRSAMHTLQAMDRSVKWWLGDLILFGEAAYGEMASQEFPDAFSGSPFAESTMRAAAWVSAAFPRGTRVDGLTWTHHRVVAELPPVEARRLLMAALAPVVEGNPPMSTRDLIQLRDRHKEKLAGTAVDEPPAALPLSAADLSDEARDALNYRLAGVGARHRTGYERGFLEALRWGEVRDAFTRWED